MRGPRLTLALPLLALLVSTLAPAAPRSTTNTEAVHALALLGTLVVACTEGGLDVFDASGRRLRTLHVEDGLPSHGCRALEAVEGSVFVATDGGIVELSADLTLRAVSSARWQALPHATTRAALVARIAALERALSPDAAWTAFSAHHAGAADGRVATLEGVLRVAVPGPVSFLAEGDDGLRIGTSEGLFLSQEGRLLELHPAGLMGPLAFGEGLAVLSADGTVLRWRQRVEPTGRFVAAQPTALLQRGDVLWTGTRSDGVHRERRGVDRRVTPRGQLCSNHVTAIARSRGQLVIGTFDQGVCLERDGAWVRVHAPALPSDHVLGVAADGDRLYVATSHGLGYFDGARWTQVGFGGRNPIGLRRLSVHAVQVVPEGVWVVDHLGASLVAREKVLRRIRRLEPPAGWAEHPGGARSAGAFTWFSSEDRGLVRFDGAGWTRLHDGRELPDNWVTAFDAEAGGRAVVGTCQDGLAYFDGATWSRVRRGLPSPMVTAVALTRTGALVGTLGGVVRFDAASGALVPVPGLADRRVASLAVLEDELVVGTEGGLSRLPVPAEAPARGALAGATPQR